MIYVKWWYPMAAKRKVVVENKVVKNSNVIKNSLKLLNINQIPWNVFELCEASYIKCQTVWNWKKKKKCLEPH